MEAIITEIESEVRMSAFDFENQVQRYNLVNDFVSTACGKHPDLEFHEVVIKIKTKAICVIFTNNKERKFISIPLDYSWTSIDDALKSVEYALESIRQEIP